MRNGAFWTDANYQHTPTYTAPGHATLMTGAWPSETGIIANEWFDRETGASITSVSDSNTRLLDGNGQGNEKSASPRRLLASTLGDELRVATNDRSKVIGISIKDRSAILPAGRRANAAYWWNSQTGKFVSSDYYLRELPDWVVKFNDARRGNDYFGARWERLLPEEEYLKRAGPDAPLWETISPDSKDGNTFPHTIAAGSRDFYEGLDYSPFSNDVLLEFTEQAIVNEHIGDDADTDILSVSFSANDYVGHRFGPYSQEVMDITLRTDRQIAKLLDFVDSRVGLENTIVVFTADHGVAPIPEHSTSMNLPGARIQSTDVMKEINRAIAARFGTRNNSQNLSANYVSKYTTGSTTGRDAFVNGNLYFNPVALKQDGVSREEIERLAGDAALSVPGIVRYFTRTQLESGEIPANDPIATKVLHGYYPQRCGDVIVVYQPYNYLIDIPITATHGSPYSYDTHVPLIIMGSAFKPGHYYQSAAPSDIAPTLAQVLGIQAPSNSVGRVLSEAMRSTE